jgi:hypothetical protein
MCVVHRVTFSLQITIQVCTITCVVIVVMRVSGYPPFLRLIVCDYYCHIIDSYCHMLSTTPIDIF